MSQNIFGQERDYIWLIKIKMIEEEKIACRLDKNDFIV